MREMIRDRLLYWQVIVRPSWRWLVAMPFVLLGLAALVRDGFLSSESQAKLRTQDMLALLPEWSWKWWIIIFLAIVLAFVLEAAYQHHRMLLSKLQSSPLSIAFEEIDPILI